MATQVFRAGGALLGAALTLSLSACGGMSGRESASIYKRYSDQMTLSGKFRTETEPADAPYTSADLARHFDLVAFEPEDQLKRFYEEDGDQRRLSKWRSPIRYRFVGDGVRASDRAAFAEIAALLSARSKLPITEIGNEPSDAPQMLVADVAASRAAAAPGGEPKADPEAANLSIFIITPSTRRLMAADMEEDKDWYEKSIFKDWFETLNPPCFALLNAGEGTGGEIVDSAIFVKAELENPLRRACFVEEFTQLLGLIFDHDEVRPSIFNDDQEFIALTEHDLELVGILYDPRLKPGMTRAEAKPIVRRILAGRK